MNGSSNHPSKSKFLSFPFFSDLKLGDIFVVSTSIISGGNTEQVAGIVLDTGVDSSSRPNVPTGLIATPGDGQVDLSWNTSSGAASYNVKRGTSEGGPYSAIGSPSTNSFSDETVTIGSHFR